MDAIAMAFDRTIAGTGSFKLAYMNKIMQNWHNKNLHTPAEIEAGDKPLGRAQQQNRPAQAAANTFSPAPMGEKERLLKLLEDI